MVLFLCTLQSSRGDLLCIAKGGDMRLWRVFQGMGEKLFEGGNALGVFLGICFEGRAVFCIFSLSRSEC